MSDTAFPITVGIVGLSVGDVAFARAFDDVAGAEVRWLYGGNGDEGVEAKGRYAGARIARDLDDLLNDPLLDAVVLVTSAERHYEFASRCLRADKHVFLQETLALSDENADDLVRLAARRSRQLMVGRVLLFHPAMRKLKELIELDELGELHYVHATRIEPRVTEESNLWILLANELSALIYLLADEPREVIAHGLSSQPSNVYEVVDGHIALDGGVTCRLHVSVLDARRSHKVVVVGSRATAVFDGVDPTHTLTKFERGGDTTTLRVPADDPLRLEADYFISAVRSSMTAPLGIQNAAAVGQLIGAVRRSLADGGTQQILGLEDVRDGDRARPREADRLGNLSGDRDNREGSFKDPDSKEREASAALHELSLEPPDTSLRLVVEESQKDDA